MTDSRAAATVLAGGGEMGTLMRALDWSSTAVGPVKQWPQSLKTAVSMLLESRFPMYIAWGTDYTQFYNDAYRPILGATKHPAALGISSRQTFAEVWDRYVGPLFYRVMARAEPTYIDDWMLPLDRFGFVEECYFTFCYSAIRNETGDVGGVFVTVVETTARVFSERRGATLRELAAVGAKIDGAARICELTATTLAASEADTPFSLLYLLDNASRTLTLAGSTGFEAGSSAAPCVVNLDADDGCGWPLAAAINTRDAVVVDDPQDRFGALPPGPWPEPPRRALVMSLALRGEERPYGVLVAGLSPRIAFDDHYRGYLDLVSGQIATALASARAYEEERQHAAALTVVHKRLQQQARATEDALASLRVEQSRLANLFRQAPAFIAVVRGPEHVYELANAAYDQLLGFRDLIGRSAREAVPEAAGQGYFEMLDNVLASDKVVVGRETPVKLRPAPDAAPEQRFVTFVYQPIVEADGSRSGIFVHGVDVTDQVRARAEAEQARADAEAANRTKSDFLAAMSHELRTPLNAIGGYAQLIEMGVHGPVTTAQQIALARIQESEKLLLSLINDVLNFAKMEAGRVEYHMREIDLADVVTGIAPMIEPQLAAKCLSYEASIASGIMVHADPEKLQQILLNLLSNAIKFTDAGGTIVVDTGTRDDMPTGTAFLRVTDSGVGIPPDKLDIIFDPFVQVHRNLTQSTGGTGLGLAISRDLAKGMGGDLRARSTPGVGSTFTISLRKV